MKDRTINKCMKKNPFKSKGGITFAERNKLIISIAMWRDFWGGWQSYISYSRWWLWRSVFFHWFFCGYLLIFSCTIKGLKLKYNRVEVVSLCKTGVWCAKHSAFEVVSCSGSDLESEAGSQFCIWGTRTAALCLSS